MSRELFTVLVWEEKEVTNMLTTVPGCFVQDLSGNYAQITIDEVVFSFQESKNLLGQLIQELEKQAHHVLIDIHSNSRSLILFLFSLGFHFYQTYESEEQEGVVRHLYKK